MVRRKNKSVLSLLLAVMLVAFVFVVSVPQELVPVASALTSITSATALPTTQNQELTNGTRYRVTSNTTISANGTSSNGLRVPSGGTVLIWIDSGVTLTVNGGAGSGQNNGGKAGIYVPSNATLIIAGPGTVKATGGDGASGSGGNNGSAGSGWLVAGNSGKGGAGGAGGAGGGAGIGSNGGSGGNGGAGSSSTGDDSDADGYPGTKGNAGGDYGTIYFLNTSVASTSKAGAQGTGGNGGGKGSNSGAVHGGGGGGGAGGKTYGSEGSGGNGGKSNGKNGAGGSNKTGGDGGAQGATGTGTYTTYTATQVSTALSTVPSLAKVELTLDRQGGTTGNTTVTAVLGLNMPTVTMPTRDRYTFDGYFTTTNNNNTTTYSGTSYYDKDGNSTHICDATSGTLYAFWLKNAYLTRHWKNASGEDKTDERYYVLPKGVKEYTFGETNTTALPGVGANPVSPITWNSATYTFKGWSKTAEAGATTYVKQISISGVTDTTNDNVDLYGVYSNTQSANFKYYNADGTLVTGNDAVTTATNLITAEATDNSTTVDIPVIHTAAQTVTGSDGKTYTFYGWRADVNAFTKDATLDNNTKTVTVQNPAYTYYAVYSNDVSLSYNVNQRYADGTDDVTGTVNSNSVTQYTVANMSNVADSSHSTESIPVNPSNIQLTRVGAEAFLGWRIVENGADTESETATIPVTGGTANISADTTVTAVFLDSRKTVKYVQPDGSVIETKTVRYNYGNEGANPADRAGIVPTIDPNEIAEQKDGANHYYFNGWSQNNDKTDLFGNATDGFTIERVKDNVTFTATYTAQTHHWQQDDLATSAVACNGVAGEGHAFTDGGYHRYCTECGYGKTDTVGNYSDNTYVTLAAADVNGEMILNNRPATCTAKGSTGKTVCKFCFQTIKEAQDVTPLGVYNEATRRWEHDLQPVEAPAGATYTLKRCAVCGHEERYYNADEHTLIFVAAAPATCTEDGYTVDHFLCTDEGCGKRFADVEAKTELNGGAQTEENPDGIVLPALGHAYEVTAGKDPTCTEDGYGPGRVCARCGQPDDETQVIPATGHPEETLTTEEGFAATCTKAGKKDYVVCGVCNAVLSGGEEIPALGHDMTGIRVDMPSCTEAGKSYRYCQREGCDVDEETEGDQAYEVLNATLPALGHDMKLRAGKAATCTEAGVKEYYECARCGRTTEDAAGETAITNIEEWRVIEALDHDLGEPETVAPTCTEAGYTIRKCSRCTYTERTEGEPALGHTGGTATCKTKAVCDVCGKTYGNYGSHVWDEGAVTTEADCQHRQVTTYTCTVCGETKTEKGGYGEHDYWVVSQNAATCTAQGDVVRRCTVCGDETHELTDALGHDVSDWHMDGTVAKGTCSRCGQEVTASPSEAGLAHKCEKCGLVHEGRTGIFVQDGLYCKIIGFFRSIFKMFGGN